MEIIECPQCGKRWAGPAPGMPVRCPRCGWGDWLDVRAAGRAERIVRRAHKSAGWEPFAVEAEGAERLYRGILDAAARLYPGDRPEVAWDGMRRGRLRLGPERGTVPLPPGPRHSMPEVLRRALAGEP